MDAESQLIRVKDIELRDEIIEELLQKKEYLEYRIPNPIHLEDYIYIEYDGYDEKNRIDTINPTLYQIIVPYKQEFFYKGEHYRVTDIVYKLSSCLNPID